MRDDRERIDNLLHPRSARAHLHLPNAGQLHLTVMAVHPAHMDTHEPHDVH